MKGYIILDSDMRETWGSKEQLTQFELHKWYSKWDDTVHTSPNTENSFRFIPNILDVPYYIKDFAELYTENIQIFEVETAGKTEDYLFRTMLTKEIRIVRKLDREEWDTEEMREFAVRKNGENIKFFTDASAKIRLLALFSNEKAKELVKMPTEEELKIVITRNPYLISKIDTPSKELQKIAVIHNGMAIRCIKDPDEEIKELAIKSNWRAIGLMEETSSKLQELAKKLSEKVELCMEEKV